MRPTRAMRWKTLLVGTALALSPVFSLPTTAEASVPTGQMQGSTIQEQSATEQDGPSSAANQTDSLPVAKSSAPSLAAPITAQSDREVPAAGAAPSDESSATNTETVNASPAPSGLISIDGKIQYWRDGSPLKNQWVFDNGKAYRLDANGDAIINSWYAGEDGWHYLGPDGASVTGVNQLDWNGATSRYDFGSNGVMISNGWAKEGDTWYFANPGGALQTGWRWVNGAWYYFLDDSSMATGLINQGGHEYLLSASGAMARGWGIDPVTGKWCLANGSGELQRGWQWVNGAWYLIGSDFRMLTGLQRTGGRAYYLRDSGAMATGWAYDGASSSWYYAGPDSPSGHLLSGWQWIGGAWYWLDPRTYQMATGIFSANGARYVADSSGACRASSWILNDDGWYLTDGSCALRTGWAFVNGSWYWMDPVTAKMSTGWQNINGRDYCLSASGAMYSNCWMQTPSGTLAYLASSGASAFEIRDGKLYDAGGSPIDGPGWVKIEGLWLYIDPDTGKPHDGWLDLDGTWYLLDEHGIMQTGWRKIDGKWYWMDSSGAMATGERIINGEAYSFDVSGRMREAQRAPQTELQRRVVWSAQHTPSPGANLCAAWISRVFANAGLGYPYGNANDMARAWTWSSNPDELKVGMIVAVPSHTHTYMGSVYGHIAIYIGNDMVMDNVGYVRTSSLAWWRAWYHTNCTPAWGWAMNEALC